MGSSPFSPRTDLSIQPTPALWPTSTPVPLRELTDEDLRWLECYQAAVTVQVDWVVHAHLVRPYLRDKTLDRNQGIQAINAFSYYRSRRPEMITSEQGEVFTTDSGLEISFTNALLLNGEEFSDCPIKDMLFSQSYLGIHYWIPEGAGPSKRPPPQGQISSEASFLIRTAKSIIDSTLVDLRKDLIVGRQLNVDALIEAERPIWQAAQARYRIELPRYLQGEKVQR